MSSPSFRSTSLAVAAYCVAMGYLEAAVDSQRVLAGNYAAWDGWQLFVAGMLLGVLGTFPPIVRAGQLSAA